MCIRVVYATFPFAIKMRETCREMCPMPTVVVVVVVLYVVVVVLFACLPAGSVTQVIKINARFVRRSLSIFMLATLRMRNA